MLLKFLRKKKNMKRIMWALAILIIPAFVIWGSGTSDKKDRKGPEYAGKLFNKKISFEEYADMWRVTRDSVTRTFGSNVPAEYIDQMTWNRLIILEAANRENITIKDSELFKKIVSFPVFQKDGSFDKKSYQSMLGDSAKGFEEKLRDDMRVEKLKEKITGGLSITEEELKQAYKEKYEKIKASYISIPFADFEKDVQYTENEISQFYNDNLESFRKPEEINVKYIEIAFSYFDKDVVIQDEQIKRYFEDHVNEFKKPDFEDTPVLDDPIKKEISDKLSMDRKISLAEELAYKTLDTAMDKKNLNDTAKSFSLEVKETGFFNIQQEIPSIGWSYEFTKQGFALKPGEISNTLIKAENGFYIIELKEKKESYIPDFEQIKNTVIQNYKKDKSIGLSGTKAKEIYTAINAQPQIQFEDIAKEAGKEAMKTEFISRDDYIPELGLAKEFVEACSSLKKGEIASPVKMPDSWVISRLDEYQSIDDVKFLEEKESFRKTFLSKKKEERFNEWFQKVVQEANFVSYTSE